MAIGWFITPYRRRLAQAFPTRYCAMNDLNALIFGEGGNWTETEVLGNRAIVKVRASLTTLQTIAAEPGFRRIPLARLDDPLSSLSSAQRNALRNEVTDAGYTLAELNAAIPDFNAATLRDVLAFLCRRRLKWSGQFDAQDAPVFTVEVASCRPVEQVDAVLQDVA